MEFSIQFYPKIIEFEAGDKPAEIGHKTSYKKPKSITDTPVMKVRLTKMFQSGQSLEYFCIHFMHRFIYLF